MVIPVRVKNAAVRPRETDEIQTRDRASWCHAERPCLLRPVKQEISR